MVEPIHLAFIEILQTRIDARSDFIQVILGPRQVGKTTTFLKLVEDHYQSKVHYVSADRIFNSDAQWIREQWIVAQSQNKILAIDEIQKCDNWAEVIKSLYDEAKRAKRKVACVLLGSSSLEIQRGLSESLTGRFQLIRAHHWNYEESKRGHNLSFDSYLRYGGYPGAYPLIGQDEWFDYVMNSIVATVVEKDILQFNNVKSPSLFRQAFELLMSYPAQEISFTKLLGQLQDRGNVEVIKNYISLFEGAYLLRALEKFSNKPIKTKSSSPKILPLAPCFYFLQTRTPYSQEQAGRVFEALVGSQLVRTGEQVFYWREGKNEVDFVLKKGRKVWAIEVKSGRKRQRTGLAAFKEKFPESQSALITRENYEDFESDPIAFLER